MCRIHSSNITKGTRYKRAPSRPVNWFIDGLLSASPPSQPELKMIDKVTYNMILDYLMTHVFNVCHIRSSNITKGTRYKRAPSRPVNWFMDGLLSASPPSQPELKMIDKVTYNMILDYLMTHVFNVCRIHSSNITKGTRYKRAPSCSVQLVYGWFVINLKAPVG